MKNYFLAIAITVTTVFFASCSTAPKIQEAHITDKHSAVREEFFARKTDSDVVFRLFATSSSMQRDQVHYQDSIALVEDTAGDDGLLEQIKRYDIVEMAAEGEILVELYPDSGSFYRLRQIRPSEIVEIDKLMAQDITRYRFTFPKKTIMPSRFHIIYKVQLEKKLTREEAYELLKKHSH